MTPSHSGLIVIGHRGAAGCAPENTLASLQAGLDGGATWIEFDVRLTADRRPILLHDSTLDRTTDGHGPVSSLRIEEVWKLDAGSWFESRFRGQRVPELVDALDLLRGRAHIVLELKTDSDPDDELLDAVTAAITGDRDTARVVLSGRCWKLLADARQRFPEIEIALTVGSTERRDPFPVAAAVRASALHLNRVLVSPDMAAAARDAGLRLRAYTVNTAPELQAVMRVGVDAVFSDHPGRILRLLSHGAKSP